MPEKWTCEIVAQMHMYRITNQELARRMGFTKEYVSMVLNGKRTPESAEQKFREALSQIIQEKDPPSRLTGGRKEGGNEET